LKVTFEEIRSRYPALFAGLAATGQVTKDQIAEFYGTAAVNLDDDRLAPFDRMSNQEKMHRKIQSSAALALDSGEEFDFIVRIRPDKPIRALGFSWGALADMCDRSATIYADLKQGVHYGNLMIGDQFAVGRPDTMRVYADTFTTYPGFARQGLLQCTSSFQGHCALAQVCWMHGIEVRKIPIAFGSLQEAEPLPAAAILASLSSDAAGRMDEVDAALIEAISADLADAR
jgi:hypothetical protein